MSLFESGDRKIIPAVLIYVFCQDRVLMLHRNARPGDHHLGKWNGLGGKVEADESPLDAAHRELLEESGFDLPASAFQPLGTLWFPFFKAKKNEDWLCYVFATEVEVKYLDRHRSSDEGELHWVETSKVLELPLWAGDRHFLPLVLERRPFQGTIWYQGESVVRAEVLAFVPKVQ